MVEVSFGKSFLPPAQSKAHLQGTASKGLVPGMAQSSDDSTGEAALSCRMLLRGTGAAHSERICCHAAVQ